MRLTPEVIDTCKFIGQLCWRLLPSGFIDEVIMVPRNTVKKWVFDNYKKIISGRVDKRMAAIDANRISKGKKGLKNMKGQMRAASFHYIDDRAVVAAMKYRYRIPDPKPGKSNRYGLRAHSWQALAAATMWSSENLGARNG
jgi:hypothetical protein